MIQLSPGDIILEGMTSINGLFNGIRQGINDRVVRQILVDASRKDKKYSEFSFLRSQSSLFGYELIETDSETISGLAKGRTHGGVLAVCSTRSYSAPDPSSMVSVRFSALFEGIEDPYNFGSCLRSLYAFGAQSILVPDVHIPFADGIICKSSAGTSEMLPIYEFDPMQAVSLFKESGFKIVCANIRDSVPLEEADLSFPVLLVLGGEKRGISRALLDAADVNVRIDYAVPFRGSLGTAPATAILAHAISMANKKSSKEVFPNGSETKKV